MSALGELMVSSIRYCGLLNMRKDLVLGIMLMLKRPSKEERGRIIELLEEASEGGGGMGEEVIVPAAVSIMGHQVEEIRILAANVVGRFGRECGKEVREEVVGGRMVEGLKGEKNKVVAKAIMAAGKE
ncbi:hypothetical protein TrRE_jg1359, partial [Triparma retinervis]